MPQQIIRKFLSGEMDIVDFRRIYDADPAIDDFLQGIIDELKADPGREVIPWKAVIDKREYWFSSTVKNLRQPGFKAEYRSVRTLLNYELRMITHNVETAFGANRFYDEVYEIYYQIDQTIPRCERYSKAYDFALDVIPEYLSGGESEMYIQRHIIPLYPDTMKKGERKKAVKAAIKEAFKSEKGYPAWAQSSEWPMGADGKPATYIGKGKAEGDLRRFLFRDESTGEIITVEQYY